MTCTPVTYQIISVNLPLYTDKKQKQLAVADKLFGLMFTEFGVTREELKSHRRHFNVCRARHYFIALMRKYTKITQKDLGKMLGGRDHTTILYSEEVIHGLIKVHANYRHTYERLNNALDGLFTYNNINSL